MSRVERAGGGSRAAPTPSDGQARPARRDAAAGLARRDVAATDTLFIPGPCRRRRMLLCKLCGRKIPAAEVKYRVNAEDDSESMLICEDCAQDKGVT